MDVNPYQPTSATESLSDAHWWISAAFLLRAILSVCCVCVALFFAGLGLLISTLDAARPVLGIVAWLLTVSASFATLGLGIGTRRIRFILIGSALLLVAFLIVVILVVSTDWLPDQQ